MPSAQKILVVDPDQNSVLQLANTFRKQGWETVVAGDAVLAQSVVRKENPTAVVLSSQLPGGGAVVVVRRIRSSVHTVGAPVVVVAKAGTPSTGAQKADFLSAGANEFIEKFDASAVCDALRRQILGESLQQTATAPQIPTLAPKEVIAASERMRALAEAEILDSAPDKLVDAITVVAARLLQVPTALVSIVDKDRQFFKSQVGLPDPWSSRRETPLSHSFCQWVVSSGDELVVEDSRNEPSLAANLAVRDLGVIAYAGVPIPFRGPTLGSFCAIDSKPREWSPAELANLRNLAHMAMAAITLEKISRGRGDPGSRSQLTGAIVQNATQILKRGNIPEDGDARAMLLEIIDSQTQQWMASSAASSSV
jgi:CheY-like chemotaxis protein